MNKHPRFIEQTKRRYPTKNSYAQQNNKNGVDVTCYLFNYDDIIKMKQTIMTFPIEIEQFNKKINIITTKPTHEIVQNRQQHPVIKTFGCNVQEITSKILELLNIVSCDNVKSIADDIMKINNICSFENFDVLVNHIIKKVSAEKKFINIYSILCKNLMTMSFHHNEKTITFISCIASRVRYIFDKYINYKPFVKNADETNDKLFKAFMESNNSIVDCDGELDKCKSINYVKFIGYLYVDGVIKKSAISYCMTNMMELIKKNVDKTGKIGQTINIEMLLALLIIIRNSVDKSELSASHDFLKSIMTQCTQCRDRFMIQDYIDEKKC